MRKGLASKFRTIGAHLRWWMGRGWAPATFERRYRTEAEDAWGYEHSDAHRARVGRILAALPGGPFGRALEVGCAEGFLTRRLAQRTARLVACDLSEEAIRRAREACADLDNVRFAVADIRAGFPARDLDLCLFSDVLYYLSKQEVNRVLAEAARCVRPGAHLVFANEWRPDYSRLTPPPVVLALLDASPAWRRVTLDVAPVGGDATLTLAVYRRA